MGKLMNKYAALNLSDVQKDELANETLKYDVRSLLELCRATRVLVGAAANVLREIWQSKMLLPR